MLEGAIIGALVALIASVFILMRAKSAKGDKYLEAMPANAVSFDTPRAPSSVLDTLAGGVPAAGLKFEGRNEATGALLLGQTPSFNNFGCFFPVRVSAAGAGGSRVEVGAAPRATCNAKMLSRNLDKVLPALKTAVGAG